ncbi:hypothetical protein WN944_019007 [Citrus x changshan-huyou]|uniref:Uncharacterized protein n=1 Tax=Citrus x changshan-huyou TaxID=2935761 RepID=A0AAP0QFZ2_9ROSI
MSIAISLAHVTVITSTTSSLTSLVISCGILPLVKCYPSIEEIELVIHPFLLLLCPSDSAGLVPGGEANFLLIEHDDRRQYVLSSHPSFQDRNHQERKKMDLFKKNPQLILSEEALFSGKRKRSSVRPKDKIYATINEKKFQFLFSKQARACTVRKIGLVKRLGNTPWIIEKGVLRSPGSGLTVRSGSREALIAYSYWFRTLFARWIRFRWPGKGSSALLSPGALSI